MSASFEASSHVSSASGLPVRDASEHPLNSLGQLKPPLDHHSKAVKPSAFRLPDHVPEETDSNGNYVDNRIHPVSDTNLRLLYPKGKYQECGIRVKLFSLPSQARVLVDIVRVPANGIYANVFRCPVTSCDWATSRRDHTRRHVRNAHADTFPDERAYTHPTCSWYPRVLVDDWDPKASAVQVEALWEVTGGDNSASGLLLGVAPVTGDRLRNDEHFQRLNEDAGAEQARQVARNSGSKLPLQNDRSAQRELEEASSTDGDDIYSTEKTWNPDMHWTAHLPRGVIPTDPSTSIHSSVFESMYVQARQQTGASVTEGVESTAEGASSPTEGGLGLYDSEFQEVQSSYHHTTVGEYAQFSPMGWNMVERRRSPTPRLFVTPENFDAGRPYVGGRLRQYEAVGRSNSHGPSQP